MSGSKSSFVTNYEPDVDIDMWLRVARHLKIPAWKGDNVDGLDGTGGFYVHFSVKDLTQFWDIVRGNSNG